MTFNNAKTLVKLRLRLLITTIVTILYLLMVYVGDFIRFPIWGLQEIPVTVAIVAVYLLLTFMPLVLKYRYIYFSDDGNKIIFRYYHVGMIKGKKRSIEIPKKLYRGYEYRRPFPWLTHSVVMYQLINNRKASYPPIFLSSLSGKERKKILDALDKYI